MEWGNSYEIPPAEAANNVFLYEVWKKIGDEAKKSIALNRIDFPIVYLFNRFKPDGNMVLGWYIGNKDRLSKRIREEGITVVAVINPKSNAHLIVEKTIGKGVDTVSGVEKPKTQQNPYV